MKEAATEAASKPNLNRLLLAVLFHVRHGRLVRLKSRVKRVCPSRVGMMGCFFVLSALMVLGCFTVVTRSMRVVLL
jgi:hypothetical protein